jgi:hypothetical protein
MLLINIWATYDLSVRTEVGRKSTTKCFRKIRTQITKQHGVRLAMTAPALLIANNRDSGNDLDR